MKYVGIYHQQRNNNIKSVLLLLTFPTILIGLVYLFFAVLTVDEDYYGNTTVDWEVATEMSMEVMPWILGGVSLWFVIAYFSNVSMIRMATGAKPLQRRENPRVYNLVENLCIAGNMPMPQINVINDSELNAFASGIDEKSYTVTLTTGICERLNDEELEGVIAHELTHIRNRDTRLLIISIIFVGIMNIIMQMCVRILFNMLLYSDNSRSRRSSKNDSKGGSVIIILLVGIVLSFLAYLLSSFTRFAISRSREYMADAGGAELCGNPLALASALRKISDNPGLADVEREDVAQLFIARPPKHSSGFASSFSSLFSTHPPIEKRIAILEQF